MGQTGRTGQDVGVAGRHARCLISKDMTVRTLLSCFLVAVLADVAAADCRDETALGRAFVVCTFDPARDRIVTALNNEAGVPYGRFRPFVDAEQARGRTVRFAMNGGMYDDAKAPIGLYVQDGKELKSANTRPGPGNFHMLPNGVFYVRGDTAGVMETRAFVDAGIEPDFATQSGPMLLIDGQFHPRFLKNSGSRKYRNGVGIVADNGAAAFAISKEPVTFWEFAALYRDRLGCRDALFLDGTISSLYAPDIGRRDFLYPIGPIIAVVD